MKSFRLIFILVFTLMASAAEAAETADSAAVHHSATRWVGQLISNGFHINAPDVDYPRFPRFLLNVYNWGDRTFNSYDSTYVVSTGKNWKAQLKNYNWLETSTMLFPESGRISMHSDPYCDAGGYLSFMAVSIGYMFNMNELVGRPTSRHTFSLDFTCSRFSGNLMKQSSDGGMTITRFGDYLDGKNPHYKFGGVRITSTTGELFYFFNHKHYSRAAAYCYSKLQLRSAGTWIAGVTFAKQSINLDFGSLPDDMLSYLPLDSPVYSFRYNDYAALGGYGYNLVLSPGRWLLNFTGLVAMGYKHSYESATDGRRNMVANNFEFASALVYNHRSLFASLNFRSNSFLYYTSKFTYLNSFNSLTATLGCRF